MPILLQYSVFPHLFVFHESRNRFQVSPDEPVSENQQMRIGINSSVLKFTAFLPTILGYSSGFLHFFLQPVFGSWMFFRAGFLKAYLPSGDGS